MTSVGFLHTAEVGRAEARRIVAERAPWVRDVHLVDEALLDGSLDPADRPRRLAARIGELAGRDVDVLVCGCPELLVEVSRLAAGCGLPVVAIDQLVTGPLALAG